MELRFEWDKKKNIKNQKKHGVSFETAEKFFFDLMRYEEYDEEHSLFEDRWRTIGAAGMFILKVIFTERNKVIRIISANKADKNEEEEYFYGYGTKNSKR